jgi:hypothetical protein
MRISKLGLTTAAIGLVLAAFFLMTREENLRHELRAARQDLNDIGRIGGSALGAVADARKKHKRELEEQRAKAQEAGIELTLIQRELQRAKAEGIASHDAAEASYARTLEAERLKVASLEANLAESRQSIARLQTAARLAATKQADLLRSQQFAEAAAKQAGEAIDRERQRTAAIAEKAAADAALAERQLQSVNAATVVLEQERLRVEALERDLAAAHQSMGLLEANAKAAAAKQADLSTGREFAEAAAKQAGEALDRERQKATGLADALEAARRERVLAQEELERVSVAANDALHQAEEKAANLTLQLASARKDNDALMRRVNRYVANVVQRNSAANSERPVPITLPNSLRPTRPAAGFLRSPLER